MEINDAHYIETNRNKYMEEKVFKVPARLRVVLIAAKFSHLAFW